MIRSFKRNILNHPSSSLGNSAVVPFFGDGHMVKNQGINPLTQATKPEWKGVVNYKQANNQESLQATLELLVVSIQMRVKMGSSPF